MSQYVCTGGHSDPPIRYEANAKMTWTEGPVGVSQRYVQFGPVQIAEVVRQGARSMCAREVRVCDDPARHNDPGHEHSMSLCGLALIVGSTPHVTDDDL